MKSVLVFGLMLSTAALGYVDPIGSSDNAKVCKATCLKVTPSMEIVSSETIAISNQDEIVAFNQVAAACWKSVGIQNHVLAVGYNLTNQNSRSYLLMDGLKEANPTNCRQ